MFEVTHKNFINSPIKDNEGNSVETYKRQLEALERASLTNTTHIMSMYRNSEGFPEYFESLPEDLHEPVTKFIMGLEERNREMDSWFEQNHPEMLERVAVMEVEEE